MFSLLKSYKKPRELKRPRLPKQVSERIGHDNSHSRPFCMRSQQKYCTGYVSSLVNPISEIWAFKWTLDSDRENNEKKPFDRQKNGRNLRKSNRWGSKITGWINQDRYIIDILNGSPEGQRSKRLDRGTDSQRERERARVRWMHSRSFETNCLFFIWSFFFDRDGDQKTRRGPRIWRYNTCYFHCLEYTNINIQYLWWTKCVHKSVGIELYT